MEGLATESYVITKVAEAKLEGSDITIPVQDVKVNGKTVIKDMIADIDLTPYAKSEDVPSIEGLATEQWVTDKNYLTQHQDISHLASTEYVDEQIANVDVTEQLKDYALKSELPVNVSELNNDKGYLTQHQDISHLATKEEIPSLEGLATEEYVNSKDTAVQQWVNEKGYTTQEDIANIDFYSIKDYPIINDGDGRLVFVDENGNIGLQIEADNTIFVKDVIAGDHALTNKADKSELEGLVTEKYVDDKFSSIEIPDVDFTGLATEQWVEDKNYLTEHQNISHLATKEEIPSLDGYAKLEDIPSLDGYTKTSELPNFDEFAKTDDIPSLEGYATQQWVNEQEFAHQDDLLNVSFNDIQDSPITENNDGEVNIVDDKGNIALKVNDEGLYVKDVIAGDHVLSQKIDKEDGKGLSTEDFTTEFKEELEGLTDYLQESKNYIDTKFSELGVSKIIYIPNESLMPNPPTEGVLYLIGNEEI